MALDFETSGLSATKNAVMSFAAVAINGTTLEEIVKYDNLVKSYDSNLVYEPRAMEVNGLTKEKCDKEGITLRELVTDICTIFTEANIYNTKTSKPLIVAHNADFDKNFLVDIFKRAKVDMSPYVQGTVDVYGNFQPHVIDTIVWNKAMTAEITDNDTKFNLESCCQRAGVSLESAHNALNDTLALTDLLRYMITRLRSGSSEVTISEGKASVHRQSFEW